jgi:O-methyltransferase/aklanonic acid methyltransferase
VEQTRVEAARLGLAAVTAMTADGAEPPFEPASFDVVTGSMSIIMLPDLPAVFSRYAGILRRPGRLGMTAPALPGDLRSWTLGPLDIGRVIREIPADAVARSPRLSRMLDGEPFGGFADLLRDAGFDPVTEHREDVELRASSARDLVDWTWTNGIRMFWEQIPQPRRSRLREELIAEVARAAGGSDTVTAGYPVSYLTAHL